MTLSIKSKSAGFTMIELLIAMALGLIVLSAVLGVFNSSSLSYNVQEDLAAMQQDVRVSKMFIERDMRMAGAGLADYPPLTIVDPEDLEAFTVENALGVNGSDKLTIRYVEPIPGCGPDPDDTDEFGPCDTLMDLTLFGDMPVTSNSMKVAEELDGDAAEWSSPKCYCRDDNGDYVEYDNFSPPLPVFIMTPPGYKDENGDIAPRAEVLYVTKSSITGNEHRLNNNPNVTISDGTTHDNKIGNEFPEDSIILFGSIKPINTFLYYVNDENVLIREDWTNVEDPLTDNPVVAPIAEHIEDLQFAFGLDTDDDGVVDSWRGPSAGDFDGDGDLSDDDKPLVRTVRISVLGRTAKARKELSPELRPALEDHAASADADYFRRRLSQTTVQLRNIDLLVNGN